MQNFELSNKVAIVTGGLSGIGHAITSLLLSQGVKVVVGDIASEPCAEFQSPTYAGQFLYARTDVSNPSQVENLFKRAREKYGQIDILINNAAINGRLVSLAEQSDEDIDKVLAVNVKGVIHGMRYGIREMSARQSGVIVNIASVQGLRPIYAGGSIYAASKAAVISLTRSAALEYGAAGIRVVAVAPGPVDTPMLRAADPEGSIKSAVPLGRIGSPEELAKAVAWLASDGASYISGSVVTVDGAFLAA